MVDISALSKHTGKFGYIYPDSIHFNDHEKLPGNFLQYKVTKVSVWTGTKNQKKIINGIQFFYKNLVDGKEFTPGEHKGEGGLEGREEIVLGNNEYLTDFHIRFDQEITQIGFTTNKGKKCLFGGEAGEDKKTELSDKQIIIYAPFGCVKDELQACGVFFVDRKEFMKVAFEGYFQLRTLLKKRPEFKQNAEKLPLGESDKILLKASCLPDTAFNSIIKYCLY
ncbi:MAG: hypothetical protein MJ252_27155 [archaeon]|nr:hypothetical protein [archaeon]